MLKETNLFFRTITGKVVEVKRSKKKFVKEKDKNISFLAFMIDNNDDTHVRCKAWDSAARLHRRTIKENRVSNNNSKSINFLPNFSVVYNLIYYHFR